MDAGRCRSNQLNPNNDESDDDDVMLIVDDFVYMDDLFCETNQPDYTLGSCDATVGYCDDEDDLGSLQLMLGGVDQNN